MKRSMGRVVRATRGLGNWVVPVTAILFAAYSWNIAYGLLPGTPQDAEDALFKNGILAVGFLGIQGLFSAMKGKINVPIFAVDMIVSSLGVLIAGYALFQETFTGANALSEYQERLMWMFFYAAAFDMIIGLFSDGYRMILTDEAKIIE